MRVSDLAFGGAGVGRHDEFVILVPLALPGERVRAQVRTAHPTYALGQLEEVLEPSPDRVTPRCRHFEVCGGCAYQELATPRQAEVKARQVREALRRIGRLEEPPVLEPIAAPAPYGYRNRIELSVGADSEGHVFLGFHRRDSSGALFPVEECPIAAPPLESLRIALARALLRNRLVPFDCRTRRGFLRRVVLRCASSGETLIELRTARLDSRPLRPLVESISAQPGLRGIVQILDRGGRRQNLAPPRIMRGKGALEEDFLGLRLTVPAGAFAQTHAAMAGPLYLEALRALGEVRGRACLDLFCGVGALGLLLAREGAREVVGIEMDPDAVEAAVRNARRAGARVCRFVHGDVEEALAGLPPPLDGGRYEAAIVNPPRSGLSAPTLRRLAGLGPDRLAYVSCDPATLARDLRAFTSTGYRAEWVRPLDLFPQTAHVETVTCLVRG